MAPLCWVQPPLLPCCRVASPGRDAVLTPLLTTSRACGLLCHITSDAPGTFNISASPGVYGCGCGCRHLCHVSHLLSSNCQRLSQRLMQHSTYATSLATPISIETTNPERAGFSCPPCKARRTLCHTHNSCHDLHIQVDRANSPPAWAHPPGDTYFPVCCMSWSLGLSPSCPSGLIW